MSGINIGVLAVQGDVVENLMSTRLAINELGMQGIVNEIKSPDQISELDGLIIPGGESTMIGHLSLVNGTLKKIKEKVEAGMPVLGICAGMIMLAKKTKDRVVGEMDQPLLDVLDIKVERNAFGRQGNSFEAEISLDNIGISKFRGVFIRAPAVIDVGKDVQVISKFNEKTVAVKRGNIICTAFHPELTEDLSLHKYFVSNINRKN
ncbi:MAG: pyridoxal 5'-phosphate synthase subunit PdxT [Marine Group I thaumarchaeote]|nr:MAG: pyridoxal 5'-phosphate synthase subunit PdxT [Marine Group I thaumarchaeote]